MAPEKSPFNKAGHAGDIGIGMKQGGRMDNDSYFDVIDLRFWRTDWEG